MKEEEEQQQQQGGRVRILVGNGRARHIKQLPQFLAQYRCAGLSNIFVMIHPTCPVRVWMCVCVSECVCMYVCMYILVQDRSAYQSSVMT